MEGIPLIPEDISPTTLDLRCEALTYKQSQLMLDDPHSRAKQRGCLEASILSLRQDQGYSSLDTRVREARLTWTSL